MVGDDDGDLGAAARPDVDADPAGACRMALSTQVGDRPPHGRLVDRHTAAASGPSTTSSTPRAGGHHRRRRRRRARTRATRSAGRRSMVRARPRASTSSVVDGRLQPGGGRLDRSSPCAVDLDASGSGWASSTSALVASTASGVRSSWLVSSISRRWVVGGLLAGGRASRRSCAASATTSVGPRSRPMRRLRSVRLDVVGDRPHPVDRPRRPGRPTTTPGRRRPAPGRRRCHGHPAAIGPVDGSAVDRRAVDRSTSSRPRSTTVTPKQQQRRAR